jgi:inner membrane protein
MFGRPVLRDALLVTAVVATHGLLDALTTGGLGVEFFWPFSPARYFLPVRFLPVAPLGRGMLSPYGAAVLGVEAVFFLPAWLYAFWPRRELSPENQV